MKLITEAFKIDTTQLKNLYVGHNYISDAGAVCLAQVIEMQNRRGSGGFESIRIDGNHISFDGLSRILTALTPKQTKSGKPSVQQLRSLQAHKNFFFEPLLPFLSKMIQLNTTLTSLKISGISVLSLKAIGRLSQQLMLNKTLLDVDFGPMSEK